MTWPEWNLALPQEIARFVNPTAAVRAGLRPRTAGDLRGDPVALTTAIYDELRARILGYTSTVIGERGNQTIQTPDEVLEHGTPNCADLTTLFAAACLSADLVPVIALITKADNSRHVLVWVVPNADTRARKPTDLGRVGGVGHITKQGREAVDGLLGVTRAQAWIPVETTGAARSAIWADPPGGEPRSLDFERATEVADEVLSGATKIDLIDVHHLQQEGMQPWKPPELVAAEQRRRQRVTIATAGAAAALIAVVVGVILQPWASDARPRMGGGFNVAVAQLGAGDSDLERDAKAIPGHLADELADSYVDDPRFLVWGPDEVGGVDEPEADEVAADIGADVLVNGELAIDPTLGDVYGIDVRVHSAQHSARSPWPIAIDEDVELTIPIASVAAGVLDGNASIVSLTRTLDGLAALLADEHEIAAERLLAAQAAVGDRAGPALIPALRAWSLLVRAGFDGDPELVDEARDLAAEALRREPGSEFARIVSVSVDYMSIIPAQAVTVQVECAVEAPAERPDPADVAALRERITSMLPDVSEVGVIQLSSILGRLAVTEAIGTFADGGSLDFGTAVAVFDDIVDRAGTDHALQIWSADAHRWLGLIAQADPDATVAEVVDHLVESARLSTPIWRARTFGLAGRAHRCAPDGSASDAVCYFELAARDAPDGEASVYLGAAESIDAVCPDDFELPG